MSFSSKILSRFNPIEAQTVERFIDLAGTDPSIRYIEFMHDDTHPKADAIYFEKNWSHKELMEAIRDIYANALQAGPKETLQAKAFSVDNAPCRYYYSASGKIVLLALPVVDRFPDEEDLDQ
jgi:hypothetical protein